jgi:nitrite reductase/ring-hydroxylating ferredoxin subunit
MSRVRVGALDELEPGAKRIVNTPRGEVGVFNVEGDFFAIVNRCAHQGGPLCEGQVLDDVAGEFTELGRRVTEGFTDEKVLKCPWHGWEYYLETGDLAGDDQVSLPTFDVEVEDGEVYLLV